ncbi:hypothetical protein AYO48_03310 [Gaiella sp. SCGC AG-212-M14]|nr:hypothetical protein AYO48_03310 [Gaiella sp. SCGC AG-212-M14]
MNKDDRRAPADDSIRDPRPVDQNLANLHDDQFGSRTHGGRNVFMGLVVTTGRIGATTGRLALLPARVLARSPLVGPLRGRTERLAETGRNAEVDARRRLESAAEGVLSAPEAEHVVDGVLAGALPEAVARSLIEHRVVERLVAEVLTSVEVDRELVSAREAERTERLVSQALANPALERVLGEALESRLTLDLTDQVVRSPAFKRALTEVLGSPELRAALKGQSMSFAGELVSGLGQRLRKLDDAIERGPRRWFHRASRARLVADGSVRVPYAGIATRGVALAVDAALATMIFLTGTAVIGLVVSLVWNPRPAPVVGTVIGVAGLLVEVGYFTGFWSSAGQTPGMRLLHLRVVAGGGSAPGFGRSLVRLFGLFVAILLLFTGFLPVLVDDRRRALQDFLAGTVVVYDDDARPDAHA